jgi:aldose 1-epimerase
MPMDAYRVERAHLGPHEIAVLEDPVRGRRVRIARRGATVIGLEQTLGAATLDLADGYRDAAELDSRPSSRFAIMVPFANRVADACYVFDGQTHDLAPGVEGAQRAARHGFVRGVDFELAALGADALGARAEFRTRAIRPDANPGYPFAIDLSVSYLLDGRGLSLEACMRNVGDRAAPCFFGWHPYFRLGDAPADAWELQVPAETLVRTDASFIPLPGAQAHVTLQEEPALDFRRPRLIGAREINHAYAQLRTDDDGRARTRLRDPESGLGIAVWQESGVMLVFTADTVTRDVRRSVALEPMESWADAFNRADCADAIRLEPGAERRFRCGVEIELP